MPVPVLKVFLLGESGAGKTTLRAALARRIATDWHSMMLSHELERDRPSNPGPRTRGAELQLDASDGLVSATAFLTGPVGLGLPLALVLVGGLVLDLGPVAGVALLVISLIRRPRLVLRLVLGMAAGLSLYLATGRARGRRIVLGPFLGLAQRALVRFLALVVGLEMVPAVVGAALKRMRIRSGTRRAETRTGGSFLTRKESAGGLVPGLGRYLDRVLVLGLAPLNKNTH